jgi:CxxC-x17-CxxC domain-containing protein
VQGENTTVKEAIFGNVGTMITFRVGAADAEFLEKEFEPEFMMNDLVNLGFAQIYLKLMIDGFSSRPFSALTLPPLPRVEESQKEKIIRISRERYASSTRQEIEEKISRWSGMIGAEIKEEKKWDNKIQATALKTKPQNPSIELFIDKCWQCGVKVELPFKPDGKRPVYCKECLIKVKSQSPSSNNGPSIKSEPIVKASNQFGSLNDLAKNGMSEFKPIKKKRQEVNLSELHNILVDAVGPITKEEKKIEPLPQKDNFSQLPPKKELKPGEEVEF